MVLSPTKEARRNSKDGPPQEQEQELEHFKEWRSPDLFQENGHSGENGFASSKLEALLQASDLPVVSEGPIRGGEESPVEFEGSKNRIDGCLEKRVEQEDESQENQSESGLEGSPRQDRSEEVLDMEHSCPEPKPPDSQQVSTVQGEVLGLNSKEGESGTEEISTRGEEALRLNSKDESPQAQAASEATETTDKEATPEDQTLVVVQGSPIKDEATDTTSATFPSSDDHLKEVAKEDLVDERSDSLSPRRRDRTLRQTRPSRASQEFDDGDVAPLPFSGPISLCGYSGPISAGSISRRSDGSSTSTRSFAFPILPFDWNASPIRMPPATDRRSFWRRKRNWCSNRLCCREPSTHP